VNGANTMKTADLEKMSIKQLRDLTRRIDAAIADRKQRDKAEVKAKIEALASDAGLSIRELFDGSRGKSRKRRLVAVKYRDPNDPTKVWTGRGRQPRWMTEAGGDIERFRVR
jgi:DNA-binding protein H-NS